MSCCDKNSPWIRNTFRTFSDKSETNTVKFRREKGWRTWSLGANLHKPSCFRDVSEFSQTKRRPHQATRQHLLLLPLHRASSLHCFLAIHLFHPALHAYPARNSRHNCRIRLLHHRSSPTIVTRMRSGLCFSCKISAKCPECFGTPARRHLVVGVNLWQQREADGCAVCHWSQSTL